MRLYPNIGACAFKPSKNVSQTDMNNAIQILLINHYSIAIVYNYWAQKLGAPVSEILYAHINRQFFLKFYFKIASDSLIGAAPKCGVIGYLHLYCIIRFKGGLQ